MITLLPAVLLGAALVMTVPGFGLMLVNRHVPDAWSLIAETFSGLACGPVGFVLARRRPGNAIGWVMLGICLVSQSSFLLTEIGMYGLVTSPGVDGAAVALWLGAFLGLLAFAPLASLLLLIFPFGRFPDWPTRIVALLSGVALLGQLIGLAVIREFPIGTERIYRETPNPFQLSGPVGPIEDPGLGFILMTLCGLFSVALLLRRFVASRGIERQQYKWVVLAMAIVVATFTADFLAVATDSPVHTITTPVSTLSEALVPIAMGIAIVRYHLFNIDRVISRALVYVSLTVIVLGTYGLGVVALQGVLAPLAGRSDLAVAGTTLLVAVLVRPMRRRIQDVVDRRFNRAHYDAVRTIQAFSGRLRDEVDLDTIGAELRVVVEQTMQPATISLWVRPSVR